MSSSVATLIWVNMSCRVLPALLHRTTSIRFILCHSLARQSMFSKPSVLISGKQVDGSKLLWSFLRDDSYKCLSSFRRKRVAIRTTVPINFDVPLCHIRFHGINFVRSWQYLTKGSVYEISQVERIKMSTRLIYPSFWYLRMLPFYPRSSSALYLRMDYFCIHQLIIPDYRWSGMLVPVTRWEIILSWHFVCRCYGLETLGRWECCSIDRLVASFRTTSLVLTNLVTSGGNGKVIMWGLGGATSIWTYCEQ